MADSFFIRVDSKLVQIRLADIFSVEAMRNYVVITTAKARYKSLIDLKHLEAKLTAPAFYKIQRSFIVAVQHIDSVANGSVSLSKNTVPIGPKYRAGFLKRLPILYKDKDNVTIKGDSFFVFSERRLVRILLGDIFYVEALKNYVPIKTKKNSHKVMMAINKMEQALPADLFCRQHRSFIVALSCISSLGHRSVGISKKTILLGPTYRAELFKKVDIIYGSKKKISEK